MDYSFKKPLTNGGRMKNILSQKKTIIYLSLSILSLAAALIVTVDDNPPGIILAFVSGFLFVLALSYNFEKVNSYILLIIGSIVGFILSVIFHNLFEALGNGTILEVVGAFFFIVALFLCPPGLIIGIIGTIIKSIKGKKK